MSIFRNVSTPPITPVDNRTLDQKKQSVNNKIIEMGQKHYNNLCRMQKEGIDVMWYNPILSPQEVADAVGTNAAILISAHGALTQAIISAANAAGIQPDIKLPSNAFSINPDGSITVSEEPYTS